MRLSEAAVALLEIKSIQRDDYKEFSWLHAYVFPCAIEKLRLFSKRKLVDFEPKSV